MSGHVILIRKVNEVPSSIASTWLPLGLGLLGCLSTVFGSVCRLTPAALHAACCTTICAYTYNDHGVLPY